ncbi:MAG: hypothetical protein RMM29_01935 [Planctomycetota bacterium]|nr:hypothetical protein [Planctomycetota bacterium]MCX8040308.1 hypothetical protein [Planctomycetota bacterium]MDW8372397.1 hypothetical protein [Planctomycetota bacterium]
MNRCERYRVDPPSLVAALTAPPLLARYRALVERELVWLAERGLAEHLRRCLRLAGELEAGDLASVARRDRAGLDALLTDLFAVATWQGWQLPLERLDDAELALDDLPRGLLGADESREGAALWLLDGGTLALARQRQPGPVQRA